MVEDGGTGQTNRRMDPSGTHRIWMALSANLTRQGHLPLWSVLLVSHFPFSRHKHSIGFTVLSHIEKVTSEPISLSARTAAEHLREL